MKDYLIYVKFGKMEREMIWISFSRRKIPAKKRVSSGSRRFPKLEKVNTYSLQTLTRQETSKVLASMSCKQMSQNYSFIILLIQKT